MREPTERSFAHGGTRPQRARCISRRAPGSSAGAASAASPSARSARSTTIRTPSVGATFQLAITSRAASVMSSTSKASARSWDSRNEAYRPHMWPSSHRVPTARPDWGCAAAALHLVAPGARRAGLGGPRARGGLAAVVAGHGRRDGGARGRHRHGRGAGAPGRAQPDRVPAALRGGDRRRGAAPAGGGTRRRRPRGHRRVARGARGGGLRGDDPLARRARATGDAHGAAGARVAAGVGARTGDAAGRDRPAGPAGAWRRSPRGCDPDPSPLDNDLVTVARFWTRSKVASCPQADTTPPHRPSRPIAAFHGPTLVGEAPDGAAPPLLPCGPWRPPGASPWPGAAEAAARGPAPRR